MSALLWGHYLVSVLLSEPFSILNNIGQINLTCIYHFLASLTPSMFVVNVSIHLEGAFCAISEVTGKQLADSE